VPSIDIVISNKLGLHARAAAKVVTLASGFHATIQVVKDHQKVNAKSIMGLMMLAASQGTHLRLEAEGQDAQAALDALEELVNDKFGEGE
jgi:phosphocarrier protein HPr